MNLSNAVEICKWGEGLRLTRYICPAGYPTIGYGHMLTKLDNFKEPITPQFAEELLYKDLGKFSADVQKLAPCLNEHQHNACASFAFNVGTGKFKTSTLLKKILAGDEQGAGAEFLRWDKANGKVLKGLALRRSIESRLFLTGYLDI